MQLAASVNNELLLSYIAKDMTSYVVCNVSNTVFFYEFVHIR